MAAIDFPNSPTNGQQYTANGVTYVYSSATNSWSSATAVVYATTTQTLTNKTITGEKETRVAGGTGGSYAVDLATGNYFTRTFNANATISLSNVPATGTAQAFVFDITNAGAFTITWFANLKWPGGAAPTLTASGRDVLIFFTHDNGTTWNGFVSGLDVK
jgi:photosystem II stability/assembly factor-like uncharacterized protein